MKKIKFVPIIFSLFFTFNTFSATHIRIKGPAGSHRFGQQVFSLPNGNIVITDPEFDIPGGPTNVGAVYLYNGATAGLISVVTGSTTNDQVGSSVTVLKNGNFVVRSPGWSGTASQAGAITLVNGTTGLNGVVSASNSLVGSNVNDRIGQYVIPLTNGNYVVGSPFWDNGSAEDAGAATFGDGMTGVSGPVSLANSLVGSHKNDNIGGLNGIGTLANGNYVVTSPRWDGGLAENVGAVTFGNGTTGISGPISSSNSLIGLTANDNVGLFLTTLPNGNYVVRSPYWNNGNVPKAGAVTFGNGKTGISGEVSPSNSLVGSTAEDGAGSSGVSVLANGNYVVLSPDWDNRSESNAGAATFGNGTVGITGIISPANSLVGTKAADQVGWNITPLTNGNYLVGSPFWDNGSAEDAGAATFGDGMTGISGPISPANSLVGSTASDLVGSSLITALTNGNYVVASPLWDNKGTGNAGAATFGDGTTGVTGEISAANSLVGQTSEDAIGSGGITALTNGNYVVSSPHWHNGSPANSGAATWSDGTSGITGEISSSNSLVGSKLGGASVSSGITASEGIIALTNGNYVVISPHWRSEDNSLTGAITFGDGSAGISGEISLSNSLVGFSRDSSSLPFGGVTALANGNYVVFNPFKKNGSLENAGSVTLGNGTTGTAGIISPSNSLLGKRKNDRIGLGGITALPNGNFVINSIFLNDGAIFEAGAITYSGGNEGLAGSINSDNSVLGTGILNGQYLKFSFDQVNDQMVVGGQFNNTVTLVRLTPETFSATVSGKVQTADGRSINNAVISVSDEKGQTRIARTNQFGKYQIEVPSGQPYTFTIAAKGYSFAPIGVDIYQNITDLNFTLQ